jgi:hypothetical protein
MHFPITSFLKVVAVALVYFAVVPDSVDASLVAYPKGRSVGNVDTTKSSKALDVDDDFLALMQRPNGREMLESCAATCTIFNTYTGSCGGLTKKSDKWCTFDLVGEVCCTNSGSSSECCELSAGGIVLFVVIGTIVLLGTVVASCACCPCCPWYTKLCCSRTRRTQQQQQDHGEPSGQSGGHKRVSGEQTSVIDSDYEA